MTKNIRTADQKLFGLLSGMIAFIRTKALSDQIDSLVAQGANVNGATGKGELLLMAVNRGNAAALQELLLRGADPHIEINQHGMSTTLLHIAADKGAEHGSSRLVLLSLVAAGMDPCEKKDSNGVSAKALAMNHEGVSPVFSYPLHFSVRSKDMALCSEFLKRGFNPDDGDSRGDTPTRLAENLGLKDVCALFDASRAARAVDALINAHIQTNPFSKMIPSRIP